MPAMSLPVLVEAAARASVILAATGLAATALRRSSAAARHLVWVLGLTSALLVPAFSIAVPKLEVPIVRIPTDVPAASSVTGPVVTANRIVADSPAGVTVRGSANDDPTLTANRVTVESARAVTARQDAQGNLLIVPAPTREAAGLRRTIQSLSLNTILLAIWALGAAIVLGRMLLGLLAVQWMSRRTRPVAADGWATLAHELASDLGLRRVRFVQSATASMPMAWGIFRASVLMPDGADAWPTHRLRVVLLHELAHVKRRDCLTHLVAQVVCAAYWFNPLVWMAARGLRAERERACDDLVLAAGTRGSDYADELLDIARVMQSRRFPAVLGGASLAMAHRSQLEGRLMAILDPSVQRRGLTRARTAAAAAVFAILILPVASVQPWAEARTAEPAAAMTQDSGKPIEKAPGQAMADVRANAREESVRQTHIQSEIQTAIQGELQGHLQGEVHDSIARVSHDAGVVAGHVVSATVSGVVSGVTRSVVNGVAVEMPAWVNPNAAIDWAGHQANPNPNPNPNPRPNTSGENRGQSKADPRAVAALTEALKDSDKEVRETAMHALVELRDPRVFEPLVAALKDSSADVREQAAFGLGQLRDVRAVEPLTAALRDTAPDVREQAVFALGQIRDRRAVDPLIAALKDEKEDVREQAAFALGQIRDGKSVEALVIALKDANADVREQAAFALGQLRDPRAIEGLTAALKDANVDVRRQAAFALGQIRY